MAKLEIPVKVYFGEIDEIIRELKQLQTYKLFEGAEEVLVDINDVARVLAKHVKATTAQPEPLTDIEQRIFLAAMGREEKVCKEIDENLPRDEPYANILTQVCREIVRKVKGALWTS